MRVNDAKTRNELSNTSCAFNAVWLYRIGSAMVPIDFPARIKSNSTPKTNTLKLVGRRMLFRLIWQLALQNNDTRLQVLYDPGLKAKIGDRNMTSPNREQIIAALNSVIDPVDGQSIVAKDMVQGIDINDQTFI